MEFLKKRKGATQVNNKYTREKSNQKNNKNHETHESYKTEKKSMASVQC
jgi:hypothetical protein